MKRATRRKRNQSLPVPWSKTEVLNPELLEMILLELDMQTLLTCAQRVCHKWKHCIENSPAIQRALFFRPASESTPKVPNPLLAKHFPYWFGNLNGSFSRETMQHLLSKRKAVYLQENASWRRMLIQQPPVHSLGRIGTDWIQYSDPRTIDRVSLTAGLHMNVFYDLGVMYGATGIQWSIDVGFLSGKDRLNPDMVRGVRNVSELCEVVLMAGHRKQRKPKSWADGCQFPSKDWDDKTLQEIHKFIK